MNDLRKGIYILPNLFTSASLFCGVYSIFHVLHLASSSGETYEKSAIAIVVAALFDGLDGRVARKTKTASRFGVEYDSLSDLISFGLAPAILVYSWALYEFSRVGWLAAFVYIACGALRLARYNVQSTGVEKKYFQGLPIPMAAMILAGSTLIWEGQPIGTTNLFIPGDSQVYLLVLTYVMAALMVSTIHYRSFKTLDLSHKHPFYVLLVIVVVFTLWASKPWWGLFLMGCGYVLSGPFEHFILSPPVKAYQRAKRRRKVKQALEALDRSGEAATSESINNEDNIRPFRKA